MNLAENWCSGASFHALLWLGATPSILWVRCENNCWSSDGIEPSLIDYSISTNKDEYDFFYGKVKEKIVEVGIRTPTATLLPHQTYVWLP
jgi:hypothetical protein